MTLTKEQIAQQQRARDVRRAEQKRMLRVWMEPEELERLKAAAAAEGVTMSEWVRQRIPPAESHTGRESTPAEDPTGQP